MPQRKALYVFIFVAGAALFWSLRGWAVQAGDYRLILEDLNFPLDTAIYHIREPGSVLLWQALTNLTMAIRDNWLSSGVRLPVEQMRAIGFDVTGAFTGGLFLAFLFAFLAEMNPGPDLRAFPAALPVLVSSIIWTFVGHAEFYAPLFMGLMFFYWMTARYFRDRSLANFRWLMIGVFVAVSMHRVAVFHLPALAIVFLASPTGWRLRPPTRPEKISILVLIIAVALSHTIPIFLGTLWVVPIYVFESYNWLPELLTPFTQSWADYVEANSVLGSFHIFKFGTVDHLKHFFYFLGTGAPIGTAICLWRIRHIRQPHEKFLLVAAISGWIWAIFWHPHLGYDDWDLFCNPALPTNLLAAVLILRYGVERAESHNHE